MRRAGWIADIEALRGVAVLMVLFAHARGAIAPWPTPVWDHIATNYFDPGFGVDLFFVVSGFVIARTLLPAIAACNDGTQFTQVLLAFWTRRAWRLMPSAWLWLLVPLLLSAMFNRRGDFGTFHVNFEASVAGALAVANMRLIEVLERFHPTFQSFHLFYGVTSHYWSLSLEEQFYLVLPVAAMVLRRYLALALALAYAAIFWTDNVVLVTGLRVHGVLLGVLLAIFSNSAAWRLTEPGFLARGVTRRLVALLLPVLAIAALGPVFETILQRRFGVMSLACGVLVLIAGHDRGYLSLGRLPDRLLHWFGARSYALYLVHPTVLLANQEAWARWAPRAGFDSAANRTLFVLGGCAVIGLCAELNYRLLETKLRRHGAAIASRMLVAA